MVDDVVFLSPGQAPVGRDGFSANFSAAHQQVRVRCRSELEEVVVGGDVAYTLVLVWAFVGIAVAQWSNEALLVLTAVAAAAYLAYESVRQRGRAASLSARASAPPK